MNHTASHANGEGPASPRGHASTTALKAQVSHLLSALRLAQRAHELQDDRIAIMRRTQDRQKGTVVELRRQLKRAEDFARRSRAPQRRRPRRKKSRWAREGRWCLFGCDASSGDDT